MGSLLLLTWPILSFSELPQKTASLENYSVQNGFNRSLPLTTAVYQSTIKTSNTHAKTKVIKNAPQKSASVENHLVPSVSKAIKAKASKKHESTVALQSQKLEYSEKYSMQNGFNRTALPVKSMPDNSQVPIKTIISDTPQQAAISENYSSQNGFNRSLPLATTKQASHIDATTKQIKKHKAHSSKMKRNNLLVTKRQLSKKHQKLDKQSVATKKSQPRINQVKKKVVNSKNVAANIPPVQTKKSPDPKRYSKQCAHFYQQNDYTRAITACEKAIENNDSQAALRLAKIYSIGSANSSPDYVKAHFYATMAANQDNPEAQFLLALCYENGIGVAQDKKTALNWYQHAAQNGLPGAKIIKEGTRVLNKPAMTMDVGWQGSAQYKQALLELKTPSTRETGLETLSEAASLGYPLAEYRLAMEYLQGDGMTQDDAKAFNLLSQAANRGYVPAQSYLAWMNLLGLGTPQNTTQAVQQFLEAKQILALDEDSPEVQAKLAELTSTATPTKIQALTKNQRLAELQRGIDLLEMSTSGSQEGLAIVTKAAENNNIDAQLYLAKLYQQGEKISKQEAASATWYQRAANSGNAEAQYALGWLYYYGQGVPKNTQQALAYFTKASLVGDTRAKQAIAFVQAQASEQSVKQLATENSLRPTIASKVKEKVSDNINGIFKAIGFSGFSKKI